jgi:uncharacterized RmlC-like cupin family protein
MSEHALKPPQDRPLDRPPYAVVSSRNLAPEIGPQAQAHWAAITTAKVGSRKLGSGLVVMPPGHHSKAHMHAHHEILVYVLDGWAATLVGPDLDEVLIQGPGDFVWVGAGVPHLAVNLSPDRQVVAIETRDDPHLNADVVLLPELDPDQATIDALREKFADNTPPWPRPAKDSPH